MQIFQCIAIIALGLYVIVLIQCIGFRFNFLPQGAYQFMRKSLHVFIGIDQCIEIFAYIFVVCIYYDCQVIKLNNIIYIIICTK